MEHMSLFLGHSCKNPSLPPLCIVALSLLALVGSTLCSSSLKDTQNDMKLSIAHHQNLRLSIPGTGLHQNFQLFCQHTSYPATCIQELSSFHDVAFTTTNPLQIVSLSIRAASALADEALNVATQYSSTQGLHVLEAQCTQDCVDLTEDTKDQLNLVLSKLSSIATVDPANLSSSLRDVKAWLSSSLSYQAACSDGFAIAPGSVQVEIENKQSYLSEVISNGLSMVDTLSQVGPNLDSWLGKVPPIPPSVHLRRRLLSQKSAIDAQFPTLDVHEGFPRWVSSKERRLLQAPVNSIPSNVVVAQDGSGDHVNITAAIHNIPDGFQGRYVIYIKQGWYDEVFNVSKKHMNVTFVGDGMGLTVITGNRNVASGQYNTYRTSTVGISGSGFFARDITFQNTAGPNGHQAVALRATGDLSVFYRCSFDGYQDTLYAMAGRQFYRECRIAGTVDFIFGNAIAVFQNCDLLAKRPLPLQTNTYTAQGRKFAADVSGFVFQNCTVRGDGSLQNASYYVGTYLGRPWKAYSRVVFMQSEMEAVVQGQGWTPWNESYPFIETLYYGEFQNRGPGSSTWQRVTWGGVHPNMTQDEAYQFTVQNFIAGNTWLGSLQLNFQASL